MNAITILEAYRRTEFMKRHEESCRGTGFGIAVNDDPHALNYQKRDRQSATFFRALIKIARTYDAIEFPS